MSKLTRGKLVRAAISRPKKGRNRMKPPRTSLGIAIAINQGVSTVV
jgi:hypothetical protein